MKSFQKVIGFKRAGSPLSVKKELQRIQTISVGECGNSALAIWNCFSAYKNNINILETIQGIEEQIYNFITLSQTWLVS